MQPWRSVAITPARNEVHTIGAVLTELKELRVDEILVVANGCQDDTAEVARRAGVSVVEFQQPLGHDVGRAVGASLVDADAYLFVDSDMRISAKELLPFVDAVASGVDLALNDLDSLASTQARTHVVNVYKAFLNHAMGMPHLGINSLTSVPHCLSRRALRAVGWKNLMVPPKAMVLASCAHLTIKAVASVDVTPRNPIRPGLHGKPLGKMEELILGDHIEAIEKLLQITDARGNHEDLGRNRRVPSSLSYLRYKIGGHKSGSNES